MGEVQGKSELTRTESTKQLQSPDFFLITPQGKEPTPVKKKMKDGIIQIELTPVKDTPIRRLAAEIPIDITPETRVIVNGFQSWSPTEIVNPTKFKKNPNPQHRYAPVGEKLPEGLISHEVIIVYDRKNYQAKLIGSLPDGRSETTLNLKPNQETPNNPTLEVSLWMDDALLPQGETFSASLVLLEGDYNEVIKKYNQLLVEKAKKNKTEEPSTKRVETPLVIHYLWPVKGKMYKATDVDAQIKETEYVESIYADGQKLVDCYLLDDGWQKTLGDWQPKEGFTPPGQSFKEWVASIKSKGRKLGAWVSPFEISKYSKVYQSHPDWLISDAAGKPVAVTRRLQIYDQSGLANIIPEPLYLLDIQKPEVLDYLKQLGFILTSELGFDLLKLDYLFLGMDQALINKSGKQTRVEIYQKAVNSLMQGALAGNPDVKFLLCGAPLYPSIGLQNQEKTYVRFSDDTLPCPIYQTDLPKVINMALKILHPVIAQPQKWFDRAIKTIMLRTNLFKEVFNLSPDGLNLDPNLGVPMQLNLSYMNNVLYENRRRYNLITLGDDLTALPPYLLRELFYYLKDIKRKQPYSSQG